MGAERRSRTGDIRADANPGKGNWRAWKSAKRVILQQRMQALPSSVRPWRVVWRRGTAVALSCILAAGLMPVASFAQGSETVAAARESLRANASGTDAGGVGNGVDVANGFAADGADGAADSADGGVLVVGSEVVAGGEGSAAAQGAQGSQSARNPQGAQAAAGAASSAVGDAGNAAADPADPDSDPDADDPVPRLTTTAPRPPMSTTSTTANTCWQPPRASPATRSTATSATLPARQRPRRSG